MLLRALTIVLCLVPAFSALAEKNRPPHIIYLLADDLGWGDVGYHGSKIATPHIDSLAKRGVRLEQFYAQPVCSPTRAALMSGHYPYQLGLQCGVVRPWARHGLPRKLPGGSPTLPAALRGAGYRTAIVGKWHLGHAARHYLPMQRGFDLQYGHYNGALDYFTHQRDGGHDWHRNGKANYDKGYTTDLIGAEAARIIAKHDQSKPLFLYVPFNAPHTPLQAPQKYLKQYAHMKNVRRRTFAAMVACMDDAVGTVTNALAKHKFPPENTLIIFSSDNGGIRRLGSNGKYRAGKGSLYEGGVRVPTIAVWKGKLAAGSTVETAMHVVDMYATLLGLAGLKSRHGYDVWPAIAEGKSRPHDTIVHNITPFTAAIRVGNWKLIHNGHVQASATMASTREQWELFQIKDDPYEKRNRINDDPPKSLAQLKQTIAKLRREMAKPRIPPNRLPPGFKVPKVWGEFE